MNRRIDRKRAKEIMEYEIKLRESVGRREELKRKLAELEHRRRDIFWDVEYAMLETGIKYYDTCAEYYVCRIESEYIKAEIEEERKQGL